MLPAELVAGGAEVRGLSKDTIPMIAFALLHAQIPMGADAAASPLLADQVTTLFGWFCFFACSNAWKRPIISR